MRSIRYLPLLPSHDIDTSPQLLTVATTHAALAAVQMALERAHPMLAALRSTRTTPIKLSDAEHLAQLVLVVADELAERLDDYAAALEGDADFEDLLPF
jgi:hypothetical protein